MAVETALVRGAFTVGLKAFGYFLDYLNKIQQGPSEFKRKLKEAKTELRKMEAKVKDSENWMDERSIYFHTIQEYIHQVQDIAHDIEDVVDEFDLEVVAGEIDNKLEKAIKSAWRKCAAKRSKAANDIADLLQLPCPECPPLTSSPSSGSTIWSEQDLADSDELWGNELLDFEPYKTELLEMLQMKNGLHILVTGPGGSGKSSLVKKFYGRDALFSVYLWFPGKKFLRDRGADNFLVVVDNVQKEEDLEPVQLLLTKDTPGGKIVMTSRNTGIASWLNPKYIVDLSGGLSPADAKKLFCSNGFLDGRAELDREAQQFLDKCEGIPLAITAVASFVLSKKPKTPANWNTVYESLGSDLCIDSKLSKIRRNLQPSYKELPSHLRDCFLYFSMFPSGEEINRGRLMRLWVAENFAEPIKGKTGEQVAEDYLKELVQRNLVVVPKGGTSDRISKCRVLKLVHEINISRRYNFITVLESDYRSPCGNNGKVRRLSAQNGNFKSLKKRNNTTDMTGLRTFLVFGQQETSLSDLNMVLAESKFLKVLDLQGVPNLKQFPDQVFDLILLKYLSMRGTQVDKIPKRIKKLVQLETLDLKRTKVTQLPEEVYKLQNLLTLLVSSSSGKHQGAAQGVQVSGSVSSFSSIQKLSLITVDTEESIQALKKLEALRKLGVVTKDGSKLATVLLEKMKHLTTLDVRSSGVRALNLDECTFPEYLERLHLSGVLLSGSLLEQISKRHSLQKISLHGSYPSMTLLDHLQDLPSLIELDMRGYHIGTKLDFKADKFKKLETLIIEEVTELESIVFQNGATPMLKKLTVSKMSIRSDKLTAQPLDHLQDLPSLIQLDLRGCYGSELEFKADKFKKLETLIIEEITELKSIAFENGATPKLKKLTVSKCYKLSTLNKPENFTAEIFGDSARVP